MKIVKRSTLLAMPEGTVFALYDEYRGYPEFGPLQIKGTTFAEDDDFCYQEIADPSAVVLSEDDIDVVDLLSRSLKNEESFGLDLQTQVRDGLHEDDKRLYVVWEKEDLRALIKRLVQALAESLKATP